MSETLKREHEIFELATEIESDSLRARYLVQACGDDEVLHRRLAELLALHGEKDSFLDEGPDAFAVTVDRDPVDQIGDVVGPYKLLQKIGEGGFGLVYMAEQFEPVRRKVALKIIKPGMDSREVIARFEAERQALALMNHPNIANVLDGGCTATGTPYFVMELVRGVSLTEYCDKKRLRLEERLQLFIDVCRAVQHAHQKGVIHRDIKPSNVMVTLHDGTPVVKVIDFGVAKAINQQLTEKTLFTRYGQMIGTPQYMSPEQAEMSGLDVDTRSDIYSLGVLLYELLVGSTPLTKERFNEAGFAEMQRLICEEEAVRPRNRLSTTAAQQLTNLAELRGLTAENLASEIEDDLEWIVMKTLEKERDRRYATPRDLYRDLERYLEHETVEARPPSVAYRLAKFARRNRSATITAALIAATLLIATVSSTIMWRRSERYATELEQSNHLVQANADRANTERERFEELSQVANSQAKKLEFQLYSNSLQRVSELIGELSFIEAKQVLNSCDEKMRDWEWDRLSNLALSQESSSFPSDAVPMFTSDGQRLITVGGRDETKSIRVWDLSSGECLSVFQVDSPSSLVICDLHPNEKFVVTGNSTGDLYLVDIENSEAVYEIPGAHIERADGIGFRPDDGEVFASAGWDGKMKIWNTASGDLQVERSVPAALRCAAFDLSGRFLATSELNGDGALARIWDAQTGELLRELGLDAGGAFTVAFDRQGNRFAAAGKDGEIKVWNTSDWKMHLKIQARLGGIRAINFSPNGDEIAASSGAYIAFHEVATGHETRQLSTDLEKIFWTTYSPSGNEFATYGHSLTSHLTVVHDLTSQTADSVGHFSLDGASDEWIMTGDFDSTGQFFAAAGTDRVIRVWDSSSGQMVESFAGHLARVDALCWGKPNQFYSYDTLGTVYAWQIGRPNCRWKTQIPQRSFPSQLNHSIDVSPLKPEIAVGTGDGNVQLLSTSTGEILDSVQLGVAQIPGVSYSPLGTKIAAGDRDGQLFLIDSETRETVTSIKAANKTRDIAFSPDSKTVAVLGEKGRLAVYEVDSGDQVYKTRCSYPSLWALAYSKSGNRLLISSGTQYERLLIVDTSTGRELLQLPYGDCFNLAYCPDSDCLATFGKRGLVRVFHSAHRPRNAREQRKASETISVVRRQKVPGDLNATVEKIRADESLTKIEKESAVALARIWMDSPHDLQWKAREILMKRTQGSADEALRLAEAASRILPDCPECSVTLGLALFHSGKEEQAQTVLEAAVPKLRLEHLHADEAGPLSESQTYAQAILAQLQHRSGDTESAQKWLSQADSSLPKAASRDSILAKFIASVSSEIGAIEQD